MSASPIMLLLIFLVMMVVFLLGWKVIFGGAKSTLSNARRRTVALRSSLEEEDPNDPVILASKLKKSKSLKPKKQPLTAEEKMFQAGLLSSRLRKEFKRVQIICPFAVGILTCLLMLQVADPILQYSGIILGFAAGWRLPSFILDRKIRLRDEEIMYYLPLVIEQIAIGVSSSLDTGPCVQLVVQMADERDTHNAVTELFKVVGHFAKQGVALEEALTEVGKKAGHVELKHAFMSLAQVSRHGGEVSKQLQELANSVTVQRENKIEEQIKKLELKATGPVAFVFISFLGLLFFMFGSQLATGLGGLS